MRKPTAMRIVRNCGVKSELRSERNIISHDSLMIYKVVKCVLRKYRASFVFLGLYRTLKIIVGGSMACLKY